MPSPATPAQRTALITGGTDGIGRAVAVRLAGSGHRVIITGRSESKAQQALAELTRANPDADHRFLGADLALLSETTRLAGSVLEQAGNLDAVVCCAGNLSTVPEWTAEGLERTLVLNYLSRYLLVRLLLPALIRSPSGRLVLVANAGRYGDSLDLSDLHHRRGRPGLQVSLRTQFANDLLAVELAQRLQGTPVQVSCVFPGLVKTALFPHGTGLPRLALLVAPLLLRLVGQTPEQAAETPAWLAGDPQAAQAGGQFYGPRRSVRKIPPRVRRADRRRDVWSASEAVVAPYLSLSRTAGRRST